MRKNWLGLPVALLFLAALPLGCADSGGGGNGGSGGSSGSGGSGSGGSSAKGGSGGGGSATGGASGGSGGSATGGASGGSGGSGGTSSTGGSGGSGGSSATGGTAGAATGGAAGGAGGSGTGGSAGAGGTARDGGTGGQGTGGATTTSPGDGGSDGGQPDTDPGTCTDKKTNGNETDVDCGGDTCSKCGAGKICKVDSDCKAGTCDNGKCPDPFAPTGTITNNGNMWKITAGTTVLEVQTGGGKIVTFSLDGLNFLVVNSASTGSVFWTAPQADWGWPPPSEMDDNTTFTASQKDGVLSMVGPAGTDKFSISKRYWANVDSQTVTIEYTFKNGSSAEVKKAPWVVTRVYPGGLTFFPTAETPVVLPGTSGSFKAVPFTTALGAAWWKYKAADFTQDIKGGADGLEGWAAHINCGTGLEQACTGTTFGSKSMVLIKQWEDTTTAAPDEKEVELYANAGHNYVEFEQQGNYQTVAAGGTMVWTMHWMLRYLPTDVAPTAGNQALLDWVRGQLK